MKKKKTFSFKDLFDTDPDRRIYAIKKLRDSGVDENLRQSILIGFAVNDLYKDVAVSAYDELVREYDPISTTFLIDFFKIGIFDRRNYNDEERRLIILEKLHDMLKKDPLKIEEIFRAIYNNCKGDAIGDAAKNYLINDGYSVWEKDAFISHSSKDKDFVCKMNFYLNSKAIETFIFSIDSEIGDHSAKLIERIQECKYFLLILSDNSVKSSVVEWEINKAIHFEMLGRIKNILPVLIGKITDKEIPESIKDHWCIDFRKLATRSYKREFQKIAEVILK